MLYLGKYTSLCILVPLCMVAIFLEVARVKSHRIANFVDQIFGRMMRASERPAIGAPVAINGATWVLLSATLLVFIFPKHIAAVSMIMFMTSDAAAALVGRRFGRFKWIGTTKTMEGSLSFFVVAILVLLLFDVLSLLECTLVAVVAMTLEIIPLPLNDNLYVPLGTASLIVFLLKFMHKEPLLLFLY